MPQPHPAQKPSKRVRTTKIDQRFESLKDEIHTIYVKDKNTLPRTIEIIEARHAFKPCTRTWKSQVKLWGFDKNLSGDEMQILIAKKEKRALVEGKDTVFWHGDTEITGQRIENFKKRRTGKPVEAMSPSAETPANVTYHTPFASNAATEVEDPTIIQSSSNEMNHVSGGYEAGHCGTEDELYLPSSPKSRGATVTVPNPVNLVAPILDGQINILQPQSDLRTSVIPPDSPNQPIMLHSNDESPSTPKSEAETMQIDINNLPLDFSKIGDGEKTELSIALQQKIQSLPIDCPASFRFRRSLAQLYISQERFAAASKIHRKSIDVLSRTGHPFSKAQWQVSLADLQEQEGKFDEAAISLLLALPHYLDNCPRRRMHNFNRILHKVISSSSNCRGENPYSKLRRKFTKAISSSSSLWREDNFQGVQLCFNIIELAQAPGKSLELERLASAAIKRIKVVPLGRATEKVVYRYLHWCHQHQLGGQWVEAYKTLSHARDTYQLVCRLGYCPGASNQQEMNKLIQLCQRQVMEYDGTSDTSHYIWKERTSKALKSFFKDKESEVEDNAKDEEETDEESDKNDGDSMTDTLSYKYGVTFSVSEITGASNSVFYSESVRG